MSGDWRNILKLSAILLGVKLRERLLSLPHVSLTNQGVDIFTKVMSNAGFKNLDSDSVSACVELSRSDLT